jgi:hypothetical protein
MRRRRNLEVIAGQINADGSIAIGEGFTLRKTGIGLYIFTFPSTFRPISMTTSPVGPTTGFSIANPVTGGVQLWNNSSVATDMAFQFILVGYQQ